MDALLNSYKLKWPHLPWPPSQEDEATRVLKGELWDLAEVQAVAKAQLREGHRLLPITQDCMKDLQRLSLDVDDLARLILQLTPRDYDKSVWCLASSNEGVVTREERLWYPCDAYQITRRERMESGWEGQVDYYLKLCMHSAKSILLVLSAHLQD